MGKLSETSSSKKKILIKSQRQKFLPSNDLAFKTIFVLAPFTLYLKLNLGVCVSLSIYVMNIMLSFVKSK